MIQINEKAPLFELKNQNDETVSLKDYRGKKVVLYFYPKDATPGCTTQACSFRDFNKEIEGLGAVVLGISKDDVASHKKFAEKQGLNFNILADEDAKTIDAYGVWKEQSMFGKTFMGTTRSTFIISEDGLIEKVFAKADTKNNAQEVYDYIKENQD